MKRRTFVAGAGLTVGSLFATPAAADPRWSCNDSLARCEYDQLTVPVPMEAKQLTCLLEVADDEEALELYESLLPEGYDMPYEPAVGIWLVEVDVPTDVESFPSENWVEGSIAIRVRTPRRGEEGWFHLSMPTNSEGAYDFGRDTGFPKYMADVSYEAEDGSRTVEATVDGDRTVFCEWSDESTTPSVDLRDFTANEDPQFSVDPVFEGPDMHRVKYTPKPRVPVDDLDAFVDGEESPLPGQEGFNDTADPKYGMIEYDLDPDLDAVHDASAENYETSTEVPDLFGDGESLADLVEIRGEVPGAVWEAEITLVIQNREMGPPVDPAEPAEPDHPGGDWRTYGQNLWNQYTQPDEDVLGPENAALLQQEWSYEIPESGRLYSLSHLHKKDQVTGAPIVADGYAYCGTQGGLVFALNADTGERIWQRRLDARTQTLAYSVTESELGDDDVRGGNGPSDDAGPPDDAGHPGTGGPPDDAGPPDDEDSGTTIEVPRVFAAQPQFPEDPEDSWTVEPDPRIVCLHGETGEILWESETLEDLPSAEISGSPVAFSIGDRDMVLIGISGWPSEQNPDDWYTPGQFRGSYVVLDQHTGEVIEQTYVISDEEFCRSDEPNSDCQNDPDDDYDGYSGGGIWMNAAIHEAQREAYICTGNPSDTERQHEHTNAILKVDVDPDSDTFGEILDHYRGDPDEWAGEGMFLGGVDLDFGGSPNLIQHPDEDRLLVGAFQKSGTVHVLDAETMELEWRREISAAFPSGNGGTASTDGERLYVPATTPDQVHAFDLATGDTEWVQPAPAQGFYARTTVVNDVVFVPAMGVLRAFHAETGAPLLTRSVAGDSMADQFTQDGPEALFAGDGMSVDGTVAVARNTVYVNAGDYLTAYQLPDVLPEARTH